MPKTSNRMDRIGDLLKQELAQLIQSQLRDPRLGMISVMDVKVAKDLAHANVFITVLGAEVGPAVETLNKAAGLLRSLLAKNLNLRSTPKLHFVYDKSIENGRYLSALIDKAVAQDARNEESAADDQDN
jgi:ribosome-binding factor A